MEHEIVSRDEWVAARKQHVLREKEHTRLGCPALTGFRRRGCFAPRSSLAWWRLWR